MVAAYEYDELSRRTVLTYGSDANAVYTYDIGDRLTELRNKFNSTQTQTISYSSYDNAGNRLSVAEYGGSAITQKRHRLFKVHTMQIQNTNMRIIACLRWVIAVKSF
jgi:hypothetical protein